MNQIIDWYREKLARNYKVPEDSFLGRNVVIKQLENNNAFLETEAVRLSDIHPDHHVLEVGFGPGIGIEAACKIIKGGSGIVHGIDMSSFMLKTASERNSEFLKTGKLKLEQGDIAKTPFNTNTFDRVFHCNCYYFWGDQLKASKELHRIIKPGGKMVTTLNLNAVKIAQEKNLLQYGKPDPENYINVLKLAGFGDVKMETLQHEASGHKYEAIFAFVGDKS